MNPLFSKTFVRFFIGFVVIISLSFGVLALVSTFTTSPEENLAAPR